MGRYDKYKELVQEEQHFREEQKQLHERHDEVDEDTVIIETTNTVKFLLVYLRLLGKTIFGIALILLAAAGLLTLLYPESRDAFEHVMLSIRDNLQQLLGKE